MLEFLAKLINESNQEKIDKIDELVAKVDLLKDMVNSIQQNVYFNLNMFWIMLSFIATAIGVALYFLVKTWVNSRVEQELKKLNIAEIHKLLENKLEKVELEVQQNNIQDYVEKQHNWLTPTLINGWVSNGSVGYLKDAFGFIQFKGVAENGVLQDGTILFILAAGYRPLETIELVVACEDDKQNHMHPAKIVINEDGKVMIYKCPYKRILLNQIRFLI